MDSVASRKAVDNLGVRFRDKAERSGDREALQAYRHFRSADFIDLFRLVSEPVRVAGGMLSGRLKRTDTIIRKLRRERSMKLSSMDDVVGFRVIVESAAQQQVLISAISAVIPLRTPRDYLAAPTKAGYRGVHLIGSIERNLPGKAETSQFTYEIQIRTEYQHVWSTMSESYGEQVKEGGGTTEQRLYLRLLSDAIRMYEEANPGAPQRDAVVSRAEPSYYVVNYDKLKGKTISSNGFQADIEAAIEYYNYLENRFLANLNHEIALIALPGEQQLMRVSHTRYVRPGGRPLVPAVLGVASAP